jgi:hypothetical protein
MAHGLDFVEASAVEDQSRTMFCFTDPDRREPKLTAEFFSDERIQQLLFARRDLMRALYLANHSHSLRCSAAELDADLASRRATRRRRSTHGAGW